MKIVLDIKDDKFSFFMEVLKNFPFVKTETITTSETTLSKQGAARFKGLLTSEDADNYHTYLKQVRSEWDRDICSCKNRSAWF